MRDRVRMTVRNRKAFGNRHARRCAVRAGDGRGERGEPRQVRDFARATARPGRLDELKKALSERGSPPSWRIIGNRTSAEGAINRRNGSSRKDDAYGHASSWR